MEVFIIGISGAVGALLVHDPKGRGDGVSGLVRREDQRADLARRRVEAHVGDIGVGHVEALALLLDGCDALVYTAGSNGGSATSTTRRSTTSR
jgi:putative NADH-flavin reductase